MSAAEDYSFVQRSALKLKGGVAVGGGNGDTKKKKRSKDRRKDRPSEPTTSGPAAGAEDVGHTRRQADSGGGGSTVPGYLRKKTKTEIAFLKRKEQLDPARIKQRAGVSHKERVEKFNEYLSSLSEHYEQAKVSWTK